MEPAPVIRTFVELLHHRATASPERRAYTWLPTDRPPETWTNAELWARAAGVAEAVVARGTAPGDRVAVIVDEGLGFLAALYGCMLARVLAVPLHPPDPGRPDRTIPRIAQVCAQAGVRLVITHEPHPVSLRDAWLGDLPPMLDLAATGPGSIAPPPVDEGDIAYLQYTSGSTALPRGVRVSHRNLLHQLASFDHGYGHGPDSIMVSWLPATHDLGLVYGRMMPLYVGFEGVFLSPAAFVQQPIRWLQAIARFRGTHTATPNFGLELAVARTTPQTRAGLDLSSLRVIVDGAEPIRRATGERFAAAFGPHGLSPAAITHAYGMSEATAKITSEPVERAPGRFVRVDAEAYEAGRIEVLDQPQPRRSIEVASVGVPVGDTVVRIVDPDTREELGERRVGEVWVSGGTVACGYHDDPQATEATFAAVTAGGRGPCLRTGDLGFLYDGELFLSGRLKDLVILRGENHHPQDLEWTTEHAHAAIRSGGAVAFSIPTDEGEGLVVVAEIEPGSDPADVLAGLRRGLAAHGVAAHALVLVPPRTVPRTSSGKLQRRRARERFLAGELPAIARDDAARAVPGGGSGLAESLQYASPRRRRRRIAEHLAEVVGPMVGLTPSDVPRDMPLRDLGLDSVTAVELVERVGADLGVTVAGTVLFDHPTIDALAAHLT